MEVLLLHLLTVIFVSALHHFCKLKYLDLEELWFVLGRGNSRTFFPIHNLANDLDSDLVEVLPAIHALNGCDTASKVGTKSRAVREGDDCYHLLHAFGRDALSDEMIPDAEKFSLKCITKMLTLSMNCVLLSTMRNMCSLTLNAFRQLLITRQHILRAYLQCHIWLHSAFLENIVLDPLEYGYRLTEDSNLVPIISTKPSVPSNLLQPCNCQKYCKASICKC